MISAWEIWRFRAQFGLRKLLGGLDYHRSVELPYVANRVLAAPGDHILEIGSAHLAFGLFLAQRRQARVWATDLNPEVLRQRRYADKLIGEGRLRREQFTVEAQDAIALSYGDASFDWVVCVSTLEHIPRDGDAAREIARVLRPGGRAVLTVPLASEHREEYWERDVWMRRYTGSPVFFQYVYDRASLERRVVRPSGLKLVEETLIGESGLPLTDWVYSPRWHRPLEPLRLLFPFMARHTLRELPAPMERVPRTAICGLVLEKASDHSESR